MSNIKPMPPKKVAAIHDMSGLGRCALTVIIPTLSSLGIQVCPIPTAILSTHTGGYSGYSFLDLTDEMRKFKTHWKELETSFSAVYSGFLGSKEQIYEVLEYSEYCKSKFNSLILADPVMGDDGQIYKTYTPEMCYLTREIVKKSDIITPNLTEAANLTDATYNPSISSAELKDMLIALSDLGAKKVVITGILRNQNTENGIYYFDKEEKVFGSKFTPYVGVSYPGAGDVFASVLLGKYLGGKSFEESAHNATDFVYEAVKYTKAIETVPREGLAIEALWHKL